MRQVAEIPEIAQERRRGENGDEILEDGEDLITCLAIPCIDGSGGKIKLVVLDKSGDYLRVKSFHEYPESALVLSITQLPCQVLPPVPREGDVYFCDG